MPVPDIAYTIDRLMAADTNITNFVSTRIYTDVLPQRATMPAITYFVVDSQPNEHLLGIADVTRALIQIDAFSDSRQQANEIADAIRLCLETMHRGDNDGQFINTISLTSGERHLIDDPEDGSDHRRYITSQDFTVFYRTTTSAP